MDTQTTPDVGFNSLGLSPVIQNALDDAQFIVATPIQAKAIPVALTGQDIIGLAETGTGKTLAFGLPMIERLLVDPQAQALILAPTRELALQVEESIRKISRLIPKAPRTISLIGGTPIYRQIRELKAQRPRVIVATPGRLRDHMQQKTVTLDNIKVFILDEADRMLDMGFAPQITAIAMSLPKDRQTMLFSATFAPNIASLSKQFLQDPARIEVATAGTSAKNIKQELIYVAHSKKLDVLKTLLDEVSGTVLVFSRTKHGATKLNRQIYEFGHTSSEIHSNKSLGQRREALKGFKTGKYRVLVATDVASRGIDVKDIQMVINFDLPDASEDYVHRIGRTGRAGADGHAISFATPDQKRDVQSIERLIGKDLPLSAHSEPAPAHTPAGKTKSFGGRGNSRRPGRGFSKRR